MQLSKNKQILIAIVAAVALIAIVLVVFLIPGAPNTQIDAGTTVSPSPTVTVSDAPSPEASVDPSATLKPSATVKPSAAAKPSPTKTATAKPSATVKPSVKPSVAPSVAPSTSPTQPVTVTETQMIISKASGRTLTASSTDVTSKAYDFKVAQRWIVEITGSNAKIKSSLSNKYLAANGSSLALTDKADSTGTWVLEESDGGFKALKNASTNTYLLATDGETLTLGAKTTEAKGLWYLNDVYTRNIAKADTSWMEGSFGVMTHLIPDVSSFKSLAERHDAKAIVAQLKEIGADHYICSVGQNSGYWNTENELYVSMIDRGSKKRFTSEDIITELATECRKQGIKFIAYVTPMPSVSNIDPKYWGFYKADDGQFRNNMENSMLWAITLQAWADKYGDLVDGWWIDGCYPWVDFTEDMAILYNNALKHGNPNAVIAYNENICVRPHFDCEEYVCGEINNPFGTDTPSINDKSTWVIPAAGEAPKFSTGSQWHMLTYFGDWWMEDKVRFTPELWAELVNDIVSKGGAFTVDVSYNWDGDCTFTDKMMATLKTISNRIK